MPKPPPAVNTGNTVRCEVSLASIVVVMEHPLSSEASASLGDQRLAAQDAVLVGKRQPDHFELLLFDDFAQPARRLFLLARPQTVTLDKTQRVTPSRIDSLLVIAGVAAIQSLSRKQDVDARAPAWR